MNLRTHKRRAYAGMAARVIRCGGMMRPRPGRSWRWAAVLCWLLQPAGFQGTSGGQCWIQADYSSPRDVALSAP